MNVVGVTTILVELKTKASSIFLGNVLAQVVVVGRRRFCVEKLRKNLSRRSKIVSS